MPCPRNVKKAVPMVKYFDGDICKFRSWRGCKAPVSGVFVHEKTVGKPVVKSEKGFFSDETRPVSLLNKACLRCKQALFGSEKAGVAPFLKISLKRNVGECVDTKRVAPTAENCVSAHRCCFASLHCHCRRT